MPPGGTRPLRILTWNIWMMPGWTRASPGNEARAAAIAAELRARDYDIVCFQKAFDGSARDVIWSALKDRYLHAFGPANSTGLSIKISSGVWVLSRVPLSGYREIEYDRSAGVEFFSRKGAMMLEGQHQGQRFQIIATHLQGDDGPQVEPDRQAIRNEQVFQLWSELVQPYGVTPFVPLFVCGCFDTPRYEQGQPGTETHGYHYLVSTLGAENGKELRITYDDDRRHNDLADSNTGRTAEEDYILVRKNGCPLEVSWEREIIRHPGWEGPGGRSDLAYDYAVAASVRFPEAG